MTNLEQSIRAHQGADEPTELEYYRCHGLILISLCLVAWLAFVGAAWALYRAFEALAS